MFKVLVSFAVGVYTGIYLQQNYKIPNVDEPSELWKKLKEFADTYRKDD
ncbi:Uncharacterised protein g2033 [Pycnogonum litorale]